jgi:hypothetical protein
MKAEEEPTWWYCSCDLKKGCFCIYDLAEEQGRYILAPYESVYPYGAVQVGNVLYFTGGGMPPISKSQDGYLSIAVGALVNSGSITATTKLANMLQARAFHTLVAITPKRLFAIAGVASSGLLARCEELVLDKGAWSETARLNEAKKLVAVCTFNSRFLYAFGGQQGTDEKPTSTIECLDTNNDKAKVWAKVALNEGKGFWQACVYVGCREIDSDTILLWGGIVSDHNVDTTFAFRPKSAALVPMEKLPRPDCFANVKALVKHDSLFSVGCAEQGLHIYSIKARAWKTLLKSSWHARQVYAFKIETF